MTINPECLSKSNRFLKLIVAICFLTSTTIAYAQTASPPSDSYINFDGGPGLLYVAIADSNDISEIEVGLGSKGSFTDIFSYTFVYDQSTGLPSGLTYSRTNLDVYLGLGSLAVPSAFNVQVRIKNSSGSWSSWYQYVSN